MQLEQQENFTIHGPQLEILGKVETKLPAKMRHKDGVRVADIPFSHDTQLIAVIRDDEFVMITGDTVLYPGETIIAATKSDAEEEFRNIIRHL